MSPALLPASLLCLVTLASPALADGPESGEAPGVPSIEALSAPPLPVPERRADEADAEAVLSPTPARGGVTATAPRTPSLEPRELGQRFGPTLGLTVLHAQRLWDQRAFLPVVGVRVGVRYAFLPESGLAPRFHPALAVTFAAETTVSRRGELGLALGGGVRVELCGSRPQPTLLPFLSLAAFGQLVAPANGEAVIPRVGLSLAWNMAGALPYGVKGFARGARSRSPGGRGLERLGVSGRGGGEAALAAAIMLVPLAAAGAFLGFGETQLYLQPDPLTGQLIGGLGLGLAM